ncbi:fumarate/nitrate reduction transcriptional regulator Fnr [Phytohalomonas tamaricis]|uniref:fumarate/nitrate reduction transcriptional regulator Fnr n=1 Tax=Phytohalomonas tamaricis TaxID=2081032 RepID=UPI000D0B635D|nr:fumarate/nitrate reduction transcriptional regulator Fnr [Phytohalomonas tamaricis]
MSTSVVGPKYAHRHNIRCQTCSLSALCLPLALEVNDIDQFNDIIRRRAPLKKGETLYCQGDSFTSVFAVRSGSLKQVSHDGAGDEQITNFYLPSELIGLDSIDEQAHPGYVIALETTAVCEIPFHHLDTLAAQLPKLRNQLFRSMSKEMSDDRRMLRLLSRKTADERLASFFINLAMRFERCGYSPYSFRLPMSRTDIGNYLGLAVETVSRILGRFQQQNMMTIQGREVHILNLEGLNLLAEAQRCQEHMNGLQHDT